MPPENVPVHVECSIIINVIASSMVAELRGLFENFHKSTAIITAIAEMGHQNPPTPVATDNTDKNRIANGTAKQKYIDL